jgi:hypothetical protein
MEETMEGTNISLEGLYSVRTQDEISYITKEIKIFPNGWIRFKYGYGHKKDTVMYIPPTSIKYIEGQ